MFVICLTFMFGLISTQHTHGESFTIEFISISFCKRKKKGRNTNAKRNRFAVLISDNIMAIMDADTVFPAQTTCVRSFNDKRRCKRVIGGTPANLGLKYLQYVFMFSNTTVVFYNEFSKLKNMFINKC